MENELSRTYYISICDDDKKYIQYAKELFLQIKEKDEHLIFYEFQSGEELLEGLKDKERCDLLFLDIQLDGMDGNATAKAFRKEFPDALLVLCSGIYLPTTESFEVSPLRFLLKSYTTERMKNELEHVFSKMRKMKPAPFLFGKREQKNFRIPLAHILYIVITKRGSIIHTFQNGENLSYSSAIKVSEHYEKLCDFGFTYAHNSYIVHLNSVSMVTSTELELINGEKLAISRSHAKEFRRIFADYLSQKY